MMEKLPESKSLELSPSESVRNVLRVSSKDLDKYKEMALSEVLTNLKKDYPDLLIDRENVYFNGKLNLRKMIDMGLATFEKATENDLDKFLDEINNHPYLVSVFKSKFMEYFDERVETNDFYILKITGKEVGVFATYGEELETLLEQMKEDLSLEEIKVKKVSDLAKFPFKVARLIEILPEARGERFLAQIMDYYNNLILPQDIALSFDYSNRDIAEKIIMTLFNKGYLKKGNKSWEGRTNKGIPMYFYRKRKDPAYGKPEMKNFPLFLGD